MSKKKYQVTDEPKTANSVAQVALFVAEWGLEVHACTQSKRVRVEHRFKLAKQGIRSSVDNVIDITPLLLQRGLTGNTHALLAGRDRGLVEIRDVRIRLGAPVLMAGVVEHVCLGIVFLLCTRPNQSRTNRVPWGSRFRGGQLA